jgi:tRNA G18 (ribose-2'-O)-methylase SpoU
MQRMTTNYKELVAENMEEAAFWNVHDALKNRTLDELRDIQRGHTLPFAVCALSVTGELNVGMMARTACIFGAQEFIIFGRRKYDKRSTVGAQNYMTVTRIDGFDEGVHFCPTKFYDAMHLHRLTPIFVEQGGDTLDTIVQTTGWKRYHAMYVQPGTAPCLVFGNEGDGIPEDLMLPGYARISIDQRGVLRSLNVSAAAAILIHSLSNALSDPLFFAK